MGSRNTFLDVVKEVTGKKKRREDIREKMGGPSPAVRLFRETGEDARKKKKLRSDRGTEKKEKRVEENEIAARGRGWRRPLLKGEGKGRTKAEKRSAKRSKVS